MDPELPPPLPELPPPFSELPPPLPTGRGLTWLIGIVVSCAITGLVCVGLKMLAHWGQGSPWAAVVTMPSMVLVPLLNGLLAAFCWRRLRPTVGEVAGMAALLTLVSLGGAFLVLGEGSICLVLVGPLLYGLILAGALIGRVLFRHDPSRLRVSLLPVLALLVVAEPFTRADQTEVVTDEVLIHAPPARVWPQITSFPTIPEPPRFWLFKIGLPYPEATTSAGDYPGADRRCIFSRGAVFRETVARIEPARELTFDIVEIPPDPELLGHLTPHRGQFLLRDNHDGTTTLVGSTWYTLHVRPAWYFDWWTRLIFREVHLRVMEDVKRRAEG